MEAFFAGVVVGIVITAVAGVLLYKRLVSLIDVVRADISKIKGVL